jgi:PAS domain S-box-containing protein
MSDADHHCLDGTGPEPERLARSVLDSLSSQIAVVDDAGTIVAVNRAWREFAEQNGSVGPVSEETNYLVVCDSAQGEDSEEAAAFAAGIRDVLAGRLESFELEYPCHSPTQVRWFIGRIAPLHGEGPRRFVVTHENITGRKAIEEQLRERERMLTQSQRMAHVGSWEMDLDDPDNPGHGAVRWTDESFRIFGFEPGQVVVSSEMIQRAIHPEDRDMVEAVSRTALRENRPFTVEHRIVRPDGVVRMVHGCGEIVTDPSGRAVRIAGTCRDITESRQAEENLRASDERFRAFMANSPAAAWILDREGRFRYASPMLPRLVGAHRTDLEGMTLAELYAPEFREVYEANNGRVYETGETIQIVERAPRPDGSVGQFLCHKFPLDCDGSERLVGGICIDITELKRVEETLREYTARLEQLRAIDLAIVSARSPREIAGVTLQSLCRLVPCWAGAATLFDFELGEAEVVNSCGAASELHPAGARIARRLRDAADIDALRMGRNIVVNDARDVPPTSPVLRSLLERGLRSYVVVPLLDRGELLGSLMIGSDATSAYSPDAEQAVREVADRLAIAIRGAVLIEEIHAAKSRLEALSRRLIRAEEEERRRIARELHDEIGQALFAIKINLQAVAKNPVESTILARLEDSLGLVERTIDQVRSLSLDLRPSLLDDLGLVPALRSCCRLYANRLGIEVDFAADPTIGRCDPEIETACYRVAQEALNNLAKHAKATKVLVKLRSSIRDMRLSIADNGIGFDVEVATDRSMRGSSIGMLGMRERAMLAGGRLTIRSEPGLGTEVEATFPVGGTRDDYGVEASGC